MKDVRKRFFSSFKVSCLCENKYPCVLSPCKNLGSQLSLLCSFFMVDFTMLSDIETFKHSIVGRT